MSRPTPSLKHESNKQGIDFVAEEAQRMDLSVSRKISSARSPCSLPVDFGSNFSFAGAGLPAGESMRYRIRYETAVG